MPDITVTLTQDEVDLIASIFMVEKWRDKRAGLDVSPLNGILQKLADATKDIMTDELWHQLFYESTAE